jgi:hypothetical protein
MKTIYDTVHDGVVGQIVEPDDIDPDQPYADQLQVMIGVNEDGKRLSAEEFEPRARLVVLELRNYLREQFGFAGPGDRAESEESPEGLAGATSAGEPSPQRTSRASSLASARMAQPSIPSLVHSCSGTRWRIDVHRPMGVSDPEHFTVFLTGNLGGNVYRSRQMPMALFRCLAGCLEFARRETPRILAETEAKVVPHFPQSLAQELARSDVFYVTIAICRQQNGHVEPTLALYDAEDDAAPILIAMDQEIDALCHDCAAAMAAATASRG